MNNKILFKPNSLILATYDTDLRFTPTEYKFFDMLLQRCQYSNNYGFRKANFIKEDIVCIFTHYGDLSVKNICVTLEKFRKLSLRFKLGKEFVVGSAISEYTYNEETAEFSCSMSENVYKLLSGYNEYGYAPINIELTRKSKTYYTQKLYQMFRSWSKYNKEVLKEFKFSELKQVCNVIEGSVYEIYAEFKKRILLKSLKEINEKSNMEVKILKETRRNRRVVSIEFSILDHETKNYKFNKNGEIVEYVDAQIIEEDHDVSKDDISSEDYVQLIDLGIRESIHQKFINDFADYKEYLKAVEKAVEKTLDSIGGKTINTRNYKYFKAVLNNLMPTD